MTNKKKKILTIIELPCHRECASIIHRMGGKSINSRNAVAKTKRPNTPIFQTKYCF